MLLRKEIPFTYMNVMKTENPRSPQAIITRLKAINHQGIWLKVLSDNDDSVRSEYDIKRQAFNTRFQFKPLAIVLCQYTEQVQSVVKLSLELDFPIRVRSGGHDHEAESIATDVVVIDFSLMKKVTLEKVGEHTVAHVEPGIVFRELIPQLTSEGVCIPHGTCATVGLGGFMMGGGWGPWTRKQGMACEGVLAAKVVLGDGTMEEVKEGNGLLWALKGGGGFSYGIVTQLTIRTFPMPKDTIKFQVEWLNSPAYSVLSLWEQLIAPDQNSALIGTNLKIMGIPSSEAGDSIRESIHSCTFYGYYAGTQEQLKKEMDRWFNALEPTRISLPSESDGMGELHAFNAWDRVSKQDIFDRQQSGFTTTGPSLKEMLGAPFVLKVIPPDLDAPAPHKITSKMVRSEGLKEDGRENLLRSLQSSLIQSEGIAAGVHCYVTLGAISGEFYREYQGESYPNGSAFPYKDRPYTIQYQAWWDQHDEPDVSQPNPEALKYANLALDWIEESRAFNFPQTEGAFISFKDQAVPTRHYFMESYEQLKEVKRNFSKDAATKFQSRKTIL